MSTADPTRPDGAPQRADPEAFRARTFSVSLTVADLDRSIEFYRFAIGFAVERTMERGDRSAGVVLKAGVGRIVLNQDDGAKGADRALGAGVSLHFTTVQDIDELADRIKADGCALEAEPADMPWGARAFRVRDPDGYLLTISSERTP